MYGQFFLTLNTVFRCQPLTQFNSATRLLLKNMYCFNVMYKFYNYRVSSPFFFECRIIVTKPQKFVIFLKMLVVFAAIFFYKQTHAFFISDTFMNNARLKLAKNQVNAKQHLEAEILPFQIYSHS